MRYLNWRSRYGTETIDELHPRDFPSYRDFMREKARLKAEYAMAFHYEVSFIGLEESARTGLNKGESHGYTTAFPDAWNHAGNQRGTQGIHQRV